MDPFGTAASALSMVDVCRKILQKFKECVEMPTSFMEHHVKFSLCCARFTLLCPEVKNKLEDPITNPIIRECISLSIYYIAKELHYLQSGAGKYWNPEDPYGVGTKIKHAKDRVRRFWHDNVDQLLVVPGSHGLFRDRTDDTPTGFIYQALAHPTTFSTALVPGAAQMTAQIPNPIGVLSPGKKIHDDLLRALEAPGGYWNRISWVAKDSKKFAKILDGLGHVLHGLETVVASGRPDIYIDPMFEQLKHSLQTEQAHDTFYVVEESSDSEAGDYHDINESPATMGTIKDDIPTFVVPKGSTFRLSSESPRNYAALPVKPITRAGRLGV